jgi:hypothetical protein
VAGAQAFKPFPRPPVIEKKRGFRARGLLCIGLSPFKRLPQASPLLPAIFRAGPITYRHTSDCFIDLLLSGGQSDPHSPHYALSASSYGEQSLVMLYLKVTNFRAFPLRPASVSHCRRRKISSYLSASFSLFAKRML